MLTVLKFYIEPCDHDPKALKSMYVPNFIGLKLSKNILYYLAASGGAISRLPKPGSGPTGKTGLTNV